MWHPSGTLPDFGKHSRLLGWRSGTPSGFNVMSPIILFIYKRIGVDCFIHLQNISVTMMSKAERNPSRILSVFLTLNIDMNNPKWIQKCLIWSPGVHCAQVSMNWGCKS